jgi:transposase
MVPKVVTNDFQSETKKEEKVENKKVIEETLSPAVRQLRKMQEEISINNETDCGNAKTVIKEQLSIERDKGDEVGTQNLPKKLSHLEENENPTKDDNLKSKEEIESLSSLEDKPVIRDYVPSETFSPSKSSLSLKQCVNIIREQLHIQDTSVGAVVRLALEEFDTPELTDLCNKQSTPLHKTHIIITKGLGMSLSDELA